MITKGRYLYGLIRTSRDIELGDIGLAHNGAPARVFSLRVDSLAAVVSELSAKQKILPLRKNLDPHHKVIREVMKTQTIVPMTFGHVAGSEAEIARALRRNRDSICEQLDRVDGTVEMGLKVMWDVDNLFAHFVAEDLALSAFRDQLFGRAYPPTTSEQIEIGRMFEARLDREREEQTERVTELLLAGCSDVKANSLKHEKMVMDLALLIPRDKLGAFEQQVYRVAATFPAHYVFTYSGPWAPFHFVELDLRSSAAA